MTNPNSALIWLDAISNTPNLDDIIPKTKIVFYDHIQFLRYFEEGENCPAEIQHKVGEIFNLIQLVANQIGWPVFIRTDLCSAKHAGPSAYLASSKENLTQVIYETVADNEMKLWPHARASAFLIREFLHLKHDFTAFGGGLPIAREFRFFADRNNVYCYHPYWPEHSIRDASCEDWQQKLAAHHVITNDELSYLSEMAVIAAANLEGIWSVDFAQDENNKWWLIDMAQAKDSFHWEDCEKNKYDS